MQSVEGHSAKGVWCIRCMVQWVDSAEGQVQRAQSTDGPGYEGYKRFFV